MPSNAYSMARLRMVESQIANRGISSPRVLSAMREVPRHLFVPPRLAGSAYDDSPLPIGSGQTISQPYIVALMTELLSPGTDSRILEIGAGSGYQAAVLAQIAGEVWTIERIPEVADTARKNLAAAGIKGVHVILGDGTLGLPSHAPYDGILITAAAPEIPSPLPDQLKDGGRLVAPIGDESVQELRLITREKDTFSSGSYGGVRFVPLIGRYGWPEKER